MTPEQVHDKIFENCDHIVKAYRDDLIKHDKNFIEEYAGTPFLHFAREYGTHIIFLNTDEQLPAAGEQVPYLFGHADRDHIAKQVPAMVECIKKCATTKMIQYFNGKTVKTITLEHAENIAHSYYQECSIRWNNERRKAA